MVNNYPLVCNDVHNEIVDKAQTLGEVSNEHTLGVQGCGVHGLALTAGTGRGTIGTGRAGDTANNININE
jgi:hypothetical protein